MRPLCGERKAFLSLRRFAGSEGWLLLEHTYRCVERTAVLSLREPLLCFALLWGFGAFDFRPCVGLRRLRLAKQCPSTLDSSSLEFGSLALWSELSAPGFWFLMRLGFGVLRVRWESQKKYPSWFVWLRFETRPITTTTAHFCVRRMNGSALMCRACGRYCTQTIQNAFTVTSCPLCVYVSAFSRRQSRYSVYKHTSLRCSVSDNFRLVVR